MFKYAQYLGKKIAEEKRKKPGHLGDLVDIFGGANIMGVGKRYIDPRVTVYHGTDQMSAKTIREMGLKPANETGAKGAVDMIGGPSSWKDTAYVTEKKPFADAYARNKVMLEKAINRSNNGGQRLAPIMSDNKPSVIKMRVPHDLLLQNPETKGSLDDIIKNVIGNMQRRADILQEAIDKGSAPLGASHLVKQLKDKINLYQSSRWGAAKDVVPGYLLQVLSKDHAVSEVPTKFMVGNKNYQKMDFKEFSSYIKKNPAKVIAGIGLLLGGAALVNSGAGAMLNGANTKDTTKE